jgi:hypothetical protein
LRLPPNAVMESRLIRMRLSPYNQDSPRLGGEDT